MNTMPDSPLTDVLRHGAYVCLRVPPEARASLAALPVHALASSLGLAGEFSTTGGHPEQAIAFLRRHDATPAQIADDGILAADAIVHVAAPHAVTVSTFCVALQGLLSARVTPYILPGGVRPTRYTGGEMHAFAYAHQATQVSAVEMPNAILLPLKKTPEWWAKDWMERHTYFLPRYDESGRRTAMGHALAAEAGIVPLMRRNYRIDPGSAASETYDFVTYFECADAGVATFDAVCANLRDIAANPEWQFVREGPTWRGRRVAGWREMFA